MFENNTIVSLGKLTLPVEKTAVEFLLARAKEHANQGKSIYLIDGSTDEQRSFDSFEDETNKIASHFHKKGLRKGDIVIYLTTKQINQIVMLTGIWRANGTPRSLYSDEGQDIILEKVKESKAKWILCDSKDAPELQNTLKTLDWEIEIIICDDNKPISNSLGLSHFQEYLDDDGKACPELDLTENDLALILPTSGTTGASKGAMHSHHSCLMTILLYSHKGWTPSKPNIIATKSTHMSGCFFPFAMLAGGFVGIVLPKNSDEILIQTVDKYKPGIVYAFPSFILSLGTSKAQGYDISSIEAIGTGGANSTTEMKKAFLSIGNVKRIFNGYGLTESIGLTSRNFEGDFEMEVEPTIYPNAPDSALGKLHPGYSAQIRDLEELSKTLGPNQKGELVLKGPAIFIGYFKDPQKTKEAFLDGWLRTGDVAYYDPQGFIYIVDRSKDIFKYYNNHISPTELENILIQHPLVQEACVIGIQDVPGGGGEVPKAFVILNTNTKLINSDGILKITQDIKSFADDKLPSYKHLRGGVHILDELPKGKTGKIARNLLL